MSSWLWGLPTTLCADLMDRQDLVWWTTKQHHLLISCSLTLLVVNCESWSYLSVVCQQVAVLEEYFQCSICLNTMQAAMMTSCGHRYCNKCIGEWVDRHHNCPCCNGALDRTRLVKDHQFDGLIGVCSGNLFWRTPWRWNCLKTEILICLLHIFHVFSVLLRQTFIEEGVILMNTAVCLPHCACVLIEADCWWLC